MGVFQKYAGAGYGDYLIPVAPPGSTLSEGFVILPKDHGKVPASPRRGGTWGPLYAWRTIVSTEQDRAAWDAAGANLGMLTGYLETRDIDVDGDPSEADAVQSDIEFVEGEAPVRGRADSSKRLMLFRLAEGEEPIGKTQIRWETAAGKAHLLEITGKGFQFVAEGTHPSGARYEWNSRKPAASLPQVRAASRQAMIECVTAGIVARGGRIVSATTGGTEREAVDQGVLVAPNEQALADAVAYLPNDGSREGWISAGIAIKAAGGAIDLWAEWSAKAMEEDADELQRRWAGFKPPYSIGWGWIDERARGAGWTGSAKIDFAGVEAPELKASTKQLPEGVDGTFQDALFARYRWVSSLERVADMETRELLTRGQFNVENNHIGHPDDTKKSAWAVFRSDMERCEKLRGLTYRPGAGAIVDESKAGLGLCFNRYTPGAMVPAKGVTAAQVKLWLDHLDYIVEEGHLRDHVLDYMSFLVQKPDQKVNHAMVFGGNTRTGKDTLWAPLRLYFAHNAADVPVEKLKSSFNDWCVNKRVVFINEMYSDTRVAMGDKLKTLIAGPPFNIPISAKFMAPYEVPNILGVIIFTNHRDALAVKGDEGRYCSVWQEGERLEDGYYKTLWDWLLSGGYELVMGYLMERKISAAFNPGGVAPGSKGRDMMAASSLSEAEAVVTEAFDVNAWPDLVNPGDLALRLRDDMGRGQLSGHRIAKILRTIGAKPLGGGDSIMCPALGKRVRIWAVRDAHRYGAMPATALAREYEKQWRDHAAREAAGSDFRLHLVSGETPTSADEVGSLI